MICIKKVNNKKILYLFKIPLCSFNLDADDRIITKKFIYDKLLDFISCFIPLKIYRRKVRLLNSIIIDKKNCRRSSKPVEPYAFIRVKNEIQTIDASLNSILPVIKRGVIGFNDCDDGSEEYILEFCKKNKGFIPYKYPYNIINPKDPKLLEKGCDERSKLYYYYNEVLKLVPKNEWLIKIDCDHIFDEKKLENMMYLPKENNDMVVISRLNLHYDGNKLYFIKNYPISAAKDHWIIYNNNLNFKPVMSGSSLIEHLNVSSRKAIFSEISNFHFPFIKKDRKLNNYDDLVEFDEFLSSGSLDRFIKDKNIPVFVDYDIFKGKIMDRIKMLNVD